ncbi:MAG: 3-hydroxybutyrate dehydrogenase [Micavibrio sp.]|nr:MAG: 3-hydroxybutyrate dehydrogenase [Micavibrio sp.]
MSLKGKTALITGSTSGIGLGIAQGFADEGINIVMNGFGDKDEIAKSCAEIESKGVQCIYNGADMTKPDEITSMIHDAAKEMGSIDILVNNAGIQHVAPVEEFPPEKWDAIIAIILSSSFHTIRTAVPYMKRQGWGRIVNNASAHALAASPYKAGYVAAKHGVAGLTKVIGLELAEDNITCNAICPGYVKTPLVDGQIADTAKARGITEEEVVRDVLLKAQWTKKFVTTDQIAQIALFLCSDAAENITGTTISVDGGWTAA